MIAGLQSQKQDYWTVAAYTNNALQIPAIPPLWQVNVSTTVVLLASDSACSFLIDRVASVSVGGTFLLPASVVSSGVAGVYTMCVAGVSMSTGQLMAPWKATTAVMSILSLEDLLSRRVHSLVVPPEDSWTSRVVLHSLTFASPSIRLTATVSEAEALGGVKVVLSGVVPRGSQCLGTSSALRFSISRLDLVVEMISQNVVGSSSICVNGLAVANVTALPLSALAEVPMWAGFQGSTLSVSFTGPTHLVAALQTTAFLSWSPSCSTQDVPVDVFFSQSTSDGTEQLHHHWNGRVHLSLRMPTAAPASFPAVCIMYRNAAVPVQRGAGNVAVVASPMMMPARLMLLPEVEGVLPIAQFVAPPNVSDASDVADYTNVVTLLQLQSSIVFVPLVSDVDPRSVCTATLLLGPTCKLNGQSLIIIAGTFASVRATTRYSLCLSSGTYLRIVGTVSPFSLLSVGGSRVSSRSPALSFLYSGKDVLHVETSTPMMTGIWAKIVSSSDFLTCGSSVFLSANISAPYLFLPSGIPWSEMVLCISSSQGLPYRDVGVRLRPVLINAIESWKIALVSGTWNSPLADQPSLCCAQRSLAPVIPNAVILPPTLGLSVLIPLLSAVDASFRDSAMLDRNQGPSSFPIVVLCPTCYAMYLAPNVIPCDAPPTVNFVVSMSPVLAFAPAAQPNSVFFLTAGEGVFQLAITGSACPVSSRAPTLHVSADLSVDLVPLRFSPWGNQGSYGLCQRNASSAASGSGWDAVPSTQIQVGSNGTVLPATGRIDSVATTGHMFYISQTDIVLPLQGSFSGAVVAPWLVWVWMDPTCSSVANIALRRQVAIIDDTSATVLFSVSELVGGPSNSKLYICYSQTVDSVVMVLSTSTRSRFFTVSPLTIRTVDWLPSIPLLYGDTTDRVFSLSDSAVTADLQAQSIVDIKLLLDCPSQQESCPWVGTIPVLYDEVLLPRIVLGARLMFTLGGPSSKPTRINVMATAAAVTATLRSYTPVAFFFTVDNFGTSPTSTLLELQFNRTVLYSMEMTAAAIMWLQNRTSLVVGCQSSVTYGKPSCFAVFFSAWSCGGFDAAQSATMTLYASLLTVNGGVNGGVNFPSYTSPDGVLYQLTRFGGRYLNGSRSLDLPLVDVMRRVTPPATPLPPTLKPKLPNYYALFVVVVVPILIGVIMYIASKQRRTTKQKKGCDSSPPATEMRKRSPLIMDENSKTFPSPQPRRPLQVYTLEDVVTPENNTSANPLYDSDEEERKSPVVVVLSNTQRPSVPPTSAPPSIPPPS